MSLKNSSDSQSFLGDESDAIFAYARPGLVGLGGGGSHVAQQFAHIGLTDLLAVDPKVVTSRHLNRLVGLTAADIPVKRKKIDIAGRLAAGVRKDSKFVGRFGRWQDFAEELRSCDVIVGCVDGYGERDELERFCRRYLIPYIDIGMDVYKIEEHFGIAGQIICSAPGGLCMRCIGFLNDKVLAKEQGEYGNAGPRPQVIWPNGVLASIAVGHVVKLLTPWSASPEVPVLLEYDGDTQCVSQSTRAPYFPKVCTHFPLGHGLGDPFLTV